LGRLQRKTFVQRVRALTAKQSFVAEVADSLLRARAALVAEKAAIEVRLLAIAREDSVCRRLMTAPGVGELTALQFRCAIDEPRRFSRSRSVGAHFGMTPKTFQTGETTFRTRITGWGDGNVRRALVLAAWTLLKKNTKRSWLGDWTREVAARRGAGRAMVAAARRLSVVLHRMWVSETDFQWSVAPV
jgi:transposase